MSPITPVCPIAMSVIVVIAGLLGHSYVPQMLAYRANTDAALAALINDEAKLGEFKANDMNQAIAAATNLDSALVEEKASAMNLDSALATPQSEEPGGESPKETKKRKKAERERSITVATFNALTKSKTSRSLASFPTISDAAIKLKKEGQWLKNTLEQCRLENTLEHVGTVEDITQWGLGWKGIDIIAVQESDDDEVSQVEGYDCTTKWIDDAAEGDLQHLCWDKETITKDGDGGEHCGKNFGGMTSCKLIKTFPNGNTKHLTVMAAHASPNFAEKASTWPDIKPDIILMDANQAGSEVLESDALKRMDKSYSSFPASDSVLTTIKSAFKLRKLQQAFEGTCDKPRECSENSEGFHYIIPESFTCKELRDEPEQYCGTLSDVTSECTKYDEEAGCYREGPKWCKYASRICGAYDKKNLGEVAKLYNIEFTGEYPDLKDTVLMADIKLRSQLFDLKKIKQELMAVGTKGTEVSSGQEDLIIYKSEFGLYSTHISPDVSPSSKFMKEGEKTGFPNKLWPSDHFMVVAQLVMPA